MRLKRRLRLNLLLELWYRIAYKALSFGSLEPGNIETASQDPEAAIRWIPTVEVERQSKAALLTHPPSHVTYRFRVPPRAVFRAFVALIPEVWGKNLGGVRFDVSVSSESGGSSVSQYRCSHPTQFSEQRRWVEFKLSLREFANQEVKLTLSTSTEPEVSTEYAWAVWGNPVILSRQLLYRLGSLCTSPLRMGANLYYFLRRVYQNGYMIRSLVARDLRKRYLGSFLGIFWSVIPPLTQLIIYYFLHCCPVYFSRYS